MSRKMTLEEMEKVIKDNGLSEIVYDYFTDSDFVKVIRCKDCKYYSTDNMGYCNKPNSGLMFAEENDFCSYGERKESKVKRCFDIPKEVAEMLLEDTERRKSE